jgi:hypothetical protein
VFGLIAPLLARHIARHRIEVRIYSRAAVIHRGYVKMM